MLKIDTVNTNTTEAKALLSYADIVETLGMRVGLEGNLPSSAPGTTVNLEWQAMEADGSPGGVLVHVVVDHNYVAPAAQPAKDNGASAVRDATQVVADSVPPAPPADLAASIAAIAGRQGG